MIHYIKGIITQTLPGKVVIENNGIGYEVFVAENSEALLLNDNSLITLYTYMAVKEDDISLYGFMNQDELKMFMLLITVSGVGSKGALAILSKLDPVSLKKAIVFEDVDSITRANGIGKKTAQRIILELKEKIKDDNIGFASTSSFSVEKGSAKEEAAMALQALGFTKTEAMSALIGINDENLKPEEYIRLALRSRK